MVNARPHWYLLAATLGLTACSAVGPDYRVPPSATINDASAQGAFVAPPSSTTNDGAVATQWWRLYNDEKLDRLIAETLSANTDLRIAEANLLRTQATAEQSRTDGTWNASLNLGTQYAQRSAEAYLHAGPVPDRQIYDIGIGVSYDLDLFGGIRRGIEAADAQTDAAQAARDLVRINVAAQTAFAYAQLCNAGHQRLAAQQTLAAQRAILDITAQLVNAGRIASPELLRARASLEQLSATLPTFEARQNAARFRLATLAGRPPQTQTADSLNCQQPLQLQASLSTGDGAALLRRRPDVRAAERQLGASTARIGVATAALYPDIQIGASLGSTGAASDFDGALTRRYGIGPSIHWQLNTSIARAQIAQADAQAQADLARFDGAVLNALREVETSISNYDQDQQRLARLQQASEQSMAFAAQTQQLRAAGRSGPLAAHAAARDAAVAAQNLANAQEQINVDQINLFLALGGGWQTP